MSTETAINKVRTEKSAIRQAILGKLVNLPEAELIDQYYTYINKIPLPAVVDLSNLLETDIDAAKEKYPVGTELDDTFTNENGVVENQPIRIVDYRTVIGEDGFEHYAAIAQRVHATTEKVAYDVNGHESYDLSTLDVYLNGEYYNHCSYALRRAMGKAKIRYALSSSDQGEVTVSVFAPAASEMQALRNSFETAALFPAFEYYTTKITSATNASNANRAAKNVAGVAQPTLTRTKYTNGSIVYFNTDGSVQNTNTTTARSVQPCFVLLGSRLKVDVNFDAAGGTPVPATQKVEIGTFDTKPEPDPEKADATFVGWFNQGQVPDFVGEIPVMFRMNGGTPQETTQYVKSGEKAVEPSAVPTQEGYEFLGWYKAGQIPEGWDGINIK